jgi:WD40 repeat protein
VIYSDYVASPLTHLYAADSGEKLAEFTGYESLFLANGRTFISLATDGLVQQWDTTTPNPAPQTIARYGTPISDLALSSNGELAALVNETGVELRRTADGEPVQQYDEATAVTFSPDDQTVVLGFIDGRIQWRSLADDSLLNEMSDHAAPIRRLAFWPNQPEPTILALAENDCRVTRWQLTTGSQLEPLIATVTFDEYFDENGDAIHMSIDDFAVSSAGNLLAGRSWFTYGFGVWDLTDDSNILTELEDQPLGVRDLAFSADGRLLATGETWPLGGWAGPERGGLRLWQIDEDNVSLRWSTELNQYAGAVAFSNNNNSTLLAVGYSSGDVTLISTRLEQFVGRLETVSGVTGLAFGGNGHLLAATTRDGLIHIWQTESP